jgi:hypothetical protein
VAWPETLSAPLETGYRLEPDNQSLRTDFEVGSPRVRRITTVRTDRITVQWKFDETEMDTFRDWFDAADGAAGGSLWFNGLTLAVGTGGTSTPDCRFAEPFQADRLPGMRWLVTATLEVR